MAGRGKKLNRNKNAGSARDFAAGKKFGRPKQVWVWDHICTIEEIVKGQHSIGHWEKVNVITAA